MKIATFSANQSGRDFICSDIHGYYSILEQTLEGVDFDPQTDRLFALGDLIDHGHESHLVTDYLAKPWFHSVLGNHEMMLLGSFDSGLPQIQARWQQWGGHWASELDRQTLARYYQAFSGLPMAIELQLVDGKKVALVHAQLPDICDWARVKSVLGEKDQNDNSTPDPLLHGMLWDKGQAFRTTEMQARIQPVENIDHVFHGHTIVEQITTVSNRTFADLGSYQSGKIGLIEPQQFLADAKEIKEAMSDV